MYKLGIASFGGTKSTSVIRLEDGVCIPFALDNTDYQRFKAQINTDEAQLEDADGDLMTAEQAKNYIKELP
jgi:hypothetical protein